MKAIMHVVTVCLLLTGFSLVRSQQNRAPVWINNLQTTLQSEGIQENLPADTVLGTIVASDPEGDPVTYSTDNTVLAVDASSGVVTLKSTLNREETTQIKITFYAKDNLGNQAVVTYTVVIVDVNDNKPEFQGIPYRAVIKEDAVSGTTVFSGVSVTDRDIQRNAQISLSCYAPMGDTEAQSSCEMFSIRSEQQGEGQIKGIITLKGTLDHETKRNYILTLRARDNGDEPQDSTVNVVIEVQDVQDMPPRFLNTPLSIVVAEGPTLKGTVVGELEAQDQDTGVPNSLVLKITEDPSDYFRLQMKEVDRNGVHKYSIISNGNIDREKLEGNYMMKVKAIEMVNNVETSVSAETTVTVTVQDLNDNAPTFNQQVYRLTVPEALSYGTNVPGLNMLVSDTDVGDYAYFELSIVKDPYSVFTLSPSNGVGSVAVALVVDKEQYLDYETPGYRTHVIEIEAKETKTNERQSSTATVSITLTDMNDNTPSFENTVYMVAVREDRPIGYSIKQITAIDPDSGTNSQITYKLQGSGSEFFNVNSQTGLVTVARALDYETQSSYSLLLEARDGAGKFNNVQLNIDIIDFNDKGPLFQSENYQGYLEEDSINVTPPIQVQAVDQDVTDGILTYRIKSGNTPDNAFTVHPTTGVFGLSRPVGFQETPNLSGVFDLVIEASDGGKPPQMGTTKVTLSIRDKNDNTPVFTSTRYTQTIKESSPSGFSVLTVTATDKDFGNNAEVWYRISSGSRENFVINYLTGLIQVAPQADLDIEKNGRQYTMTVLGEDRGSPKRTGTTEVYITVLDTNNNPPRFSQATYFMFADENSNVDTRIGQVGASDPDTSAALQYSIRSDSFTAKDVNGNMLTSTFPYDYRGTFKAEPQSGEIKVASGLKRDSAAEISFTVHVRDTNADTPTEQTATATVVVYIRAASTPDLEFGAPWTPQNPRLVRDLPEEPPIGKVVIQVAATSKISPSSPVQYRKIIGTDREGYFRVLNSGEVVVNAPIDYEKLLSKQLSLQVEAYTTQNPPLTAIATILVNVLDINDNTPKFLQNEYRFLISEGTRYPQVFATITATDPDSGDYGKVYYFLNNKDYFTIDKNTGSLMVKEGVVLNRENVPKVNLLVTATNNPNGPTRQQPGTTVPLTVELRDENDNRPRFSMPVYMFQVLQTGGPNTQIGQVFAMDPDQGQASSLTYTILSGNNAGIFQINRTTGMLTSRVNLQGHAKADPYTLVIQASDGGSPPQSDQTTVYIYVSDTTETNRGPRILFPEDGTPVNVTEGTPRGTVVIQVQATDPDTGPAGKLEYSFYRNPGLEEDTTYFSIDPSTGAISVAKDLDYEKKKEYTLLLAVRDQDQPPNEVTRRVVIKLTDVDDNKPSFATCFGSEGSDRVTSVKEEQPAGTSVTGIQACDPDGPPNNKMYYYITCGNDPISLRNETEVRPFEINKNTGAVTTKIILDRESLANFKLCIRVSDDPNWSGRDHWDDIPGDDSAIRLEVNVDDIDDNGPTFPGGNKQTFSAGLHAGAPFGTDIIRMRAVDSDSGGSGTSYTFSIKDSEFIDSNLKVTKAPQAFDIHPTTGMVTTNRVNYLDYSYGHFKITVLVTDSNGREATTQLFLHVVQEGDRLSFMFNSPPHKVNGFLYSFIDEVKPMLSGADIVVDGTHYAVTSDGARNYNRTRVCFHVTQNSRVVMTGVTGRQMFESRKDQLQPIYDKYGMTGLGMCLVKMTTVWWSGYWWLWWILIAVAIIIFIICLIFICCLCCLFDKMSNKKRHTVARQPIQYAVLDPLAL